MLELDHSVARYLMYCKHAPELRVLEVWCRGNSCLTTKNSTTKIILQDCIKELYAKDFEPSHNDTLQIPLAQKVLGY
jgi:hypothetical protein